MLVSTIARRLRRRPRPGPSAFGWSRNVWLLAGCQALFMTGSTMVVAVTALVGLQLAPAKALATLPLAVQLVASTAVSYPAALLMRRLGRRRGFFLGLASGAAGSAVSALGILHGDFRQFVLGAALIGVFNCFAQYYRFAAADTAPPALRGSALSLVMAGGVLAALAGTNLARYTQDAIAAAPFAGTFLGLVLLHVLSALLLLFVRLPVAADTPSGAGARPVREVLRQPVFLVAALAGMTGYASMALLMTATPLAMHARGHGFEDSAFVIQWHVLGMFLPAFFTGRLIRRVGVLRVIALGALLMLAGVAFNLSGTTVAHFWLALSLVGVAWNFMYIGATQLLSEAYADGEAARSQGLNELFVWTAVSLASLSAGVLQHHWGWASANLVVIPLMLLPLATIAMLHGRQRPAYARG